ncbi:MAG: OmpA family protein [Akkermansia sp.]|nr:OmpA family protein [Akkermansia sp.]
MFSTASQLDPTAKRRNVRNGNRKRNGYELTRQRSMFPIAFGSGLASILVYILLYLYAPDFSIIITSPPTPHEVPIEDEPVIVRIPKETDLKKPEQLDELPPEDTKPEILEIKEPQEIVDVLDVKVEELIIAPGHTDLSVPDPVPPAEGSPEEKESLTPTPLADNMLNLPSVPQEVMNLPDPTPINASDVVITTPPHFGNGEGDGDVGSDLLDTAQETGAAGLPDDTRTLSELIGETNLGASSGVARLGSDLLFGFNECKLKSAARITMLQLAALIQKNPETHFIIEGHTDSIGGNSYNALLSMQRAAAVREWLRGNKISTEKVYIRACADNSPLADTKGNREEQANNRRVEIHMRKADEPLPEGCENHHYKVDLVTKLGVQLSKGVTIPKTYPSASASLTPEQKAKPTQRKTKPAQQNNNKPRNHRNGRRRK